MTLQAIYPHGALLLPSPVAALVRLGELMATSAFWQTVAASTGRILGGFAQKGWIRTGYRTLELIDRDRLQELCEM